MKNSKSKTEAVVWDVDASRLRTCTRDLAVELNSEQPDLGLRIATGDVVSGSTLGTCFELPNCKGLRLEDFYVRGQDLICKFPVSESELANEIYFRRLAVPSESMLAIELIYSISTDLLESSPMPLVVSRLDHGDIKTESVLDRTTAPLVKNPPHWSGPNFAFWSQRERGVSIGIGAIPNDLHRLQVDAVDSGVELQFQMRSEFLEKGVIRRLRLLMIASCGESHIEDVESYANSFVESVLPLTT